MFCCNGWGFHCNNIEAIHIKLGSHCAISHRLRNRLILWSRLYVTLEDYILERVLAYFGTCISKDMQSFGFIFAFSPKTVNLENIYLSQKNMKMFLILMDIIYMQKMNSSFEGNSSLQKQKLCMSVPFWLLAV